MLQRHKDLAVELVHGSSSTCDSNLMKYSDQKFGKSIDASNIQHARGPIGNQKSRTGIVGFGRRKTPLASEHTVRRDNFQATVCGALKSRFLRSRGHFFTAVVLVLAVLNPSITGYGTANDVFRRVTHEEGR